MSRCSHAFSEEGRRAIAELAGRRLLAAFDFDGTLAPIALRPEQVLTPAGTRAALDRLRKRCLTAIISGRARDDVCKRVGVEMDYVIGNHGIEGLPGADKEMAECLAVSRGWVAQLRSGEIFNALDPGICLEDKRYSLAVHYRQARDAGRAQRELQMRMKLLKPEPRIVAGKCVFNLLPPSSVDKGTALLRLLELTHADAALYAGDDDTDEDVFALQEPAVLSIRIGCSEKSRARLYLRAPQEIPRLLDLVIQALPAGALAPRR